MVNDSGGPVEAVLVLADGRECAVPPTGLTIGRTEDAGLMVPDPLVSHRHAQVTVRGDTYFVADLGSLNGTLLNGNSVTAAQVLSDGDVLQFAGTTLTVRIRPRAPVVRPPSQTVVAPVPESLRQPVLDQAATVGLAEGVKPPRLTISGSSPPAQGDTQTAYLALKGVLDIETADQFRARASDLLDAGFVHLSLDLAELQYMDSSGLSALVGVLRNLKPRGGELNLRNVQPTVRGIIELTRLDRLFNLE